MLQIDYAVLHKLHNAGCIYIRVTELHTENIFKTKYCYSSTLTGAPISKDVVITIQDDGFVDSNFVYYDNV